VLEGVGEVGRDRLIFRGSSRCGSSSRANPTGLGSGIDKDRPDYTVFCDEWAIGRIYETRGGPDQSHLQTEEEIVVAFTTAQQ
jgi:hypothetical protein